MKSDLNAGAYIFDLNGTVIDDMYFHNKTWFHILNEELGASLTMDQVKQEMYGKNHELLKRVFGEDHFSIEELNRISYQKELRYQKEYLPELKLIAGLDEFLNRAWHAGIKMAIGSAAIPFNIDFVLDNLNIRKFFPAIVSADDVDNSKPDPETFIKAAELLNIEPEKCIVFEDAPKGVEAAMRAGMRTVTLTTTHDQADFADYPNIICFSKDYTGFSELF